MIRTECAVCREVYRLKDDFGGQWVRCRECKAGFYVKKRYTPRFEEFLARAPKPSRVRREWKPRALPLSPAVATPAVPAEPRLDLRLIGLGVSGLAVTALPTL